MGVAYDAVGRRIAQSDPLGRSEVYSYDDGNRRLVVIPYRSCCGELCA